MFELRMYLGEGISIDGRMIPYCLVTSDVYSESEIFVEKYGMEGY
jgi:hypothetical protein